MTRFTKADLDSEAYAQKLNQMLWGRCKAGKITQTEYTALVENRDTNLKRLIAEKNLTLGEARQVRVLIMESRLTMTAAIAVAKRKMTLADARLASSASTVAKKEERKARPKLSNKQGNSRRLRKGGSSGGRAESVSKKQETVDISPRKVKSTSVGKGERSRRQESNAQRGRHKQVDFRKQAKSRQIDSQKDEQPRTEQSQKKTAPRAEQSPQVRAQQSKRQPRPTVASGHPNARPNLPKPSQQPVQRQKIQHRAAQRRQPYRERFAEVQGSEVDYNRTCREESSAAREWRDWREERNIEIRNKQTGKVLPPIPAGQDWYPGMGFLPANEPVKGLKPSKNPQKASSKDFLDGSLDSSPKVSDLHKQPSIRQKDASPSASTVWPAQNPGAKPKQQKRVFGKTRRFVPRKGAGKRPSV